MTAIRIEPLTKCSATPNHLDWDGIIVEVLRGTLTLAYNGETVVLREGETFKWGGNGRPVAQLT